MRAMHFAAAGQNGACRVSTEIPRRGGVRNAGFVAVQAPGAEIRTFEVLKYLRAGKWPENGENGQN